MRLSGIRVGDIVRVNDGLPYLATVLAKPGPSRLTVKPMMTHRPTLPPREVKATWIDAHWRKVA